MKSKLSQLNLAFRLAVSLTVLQTAAGASDIGEVNPNLMMQQALAAYQKSDFPSAIKLLTARAQMAPEDPNIYYYLGNCYLHTKQPEQAAHMYSTCIRKSPTSQAGQYSLAALESISTMPKTPPVDNPAPDPAATAANKDSLLTERALDKAFNDAADRIRNQRQTLRVKVDNMWDDMHEDMSSLSPKITTNYAAELEKLQRETENKVLDLQTRELRLESRMLAPDKIDVRAIPQIPDEKKDDTKTALGSLLQYFNPEKPYDPFGAEITPELTEKFMTLRDVFGELSTYTPQARKMAKQVFFQLKSGIESKQDQLDQQIFQARATLIRDIVQIKSTYGSVPTYNITPASFITSSKVPRSKQNSMTPAELEASQATERSKKRLQDLKDSYLRDVDALIAGAKERVSGIVVQTGQMNSQLKKPSGNIQLVPLGTDAYTRNYVNFADKPGFGLKPKEPTPEPLKAEAGKLQPKSTQGKPTAGKK